MWVLIRALSFGTISIFYKNMIDEEKEVIASNYNITAAQLANMLEVVVSYRNIVAHGERTFCARLPKTRIHSIEYYKKIMHSPERKRRNKIWPKRFFGVIDLL